MSSKKSNSQQKFLVAQLFKNRLAFEMGSYLYDPVYNDPELLLGDLLCLEYNIACIKDDLKISLKKFK